MIHVHTAPHGPGWCWLLVDTDTGERLHTGQQAYTSERFAHNIGIRQKTALTTRQTSGPK